MAVTGKWLLIESNSTAFSLSLFALAKDIITANNLCSMKTPLHNT